jgi:SAM-dependent methyltransferase
VLTVDFDRLGLRPGERVLDLGCGAGRHAFEMYRRGADVVAFDQDADELSKVRDLFAAMRQAGEVPEGAEADVKEGDALALPFADGEFDRIVAAEILEHVPADLQAISELFRVLRPGGSIALTVPRWLPEVVCWKLSREYHDVPGGHIRIYTDAELVGKAESVGLVYDGRHYAHALHSPYWWIKCAVGVGNDEHPLARTYHRLLVWDIMKKPRLTRWAERALNPVLGKSLVVYLHKPLVDPRAAAEDAGDAVNAVDAGDVVDADGA